MSPAQVRTKGRARISSYFTNSIKSDEKYAQHRENGEEIRWLLRNQENIFKLIFLSFFRLAYVHF